MSLSAKKWAKLADEQQFKQLANAQASAAQWRNGLIALTALLTTVTIIKGPEKASELSSNGRYLAAALLLIAFIALLAGSAFAMYAAYGFPDRDKLLTGEALRDWTAVEAGKTRTMTIWAAVSFVVAMPLIAGAIGLTWFDKRMFGTDPAAFVMVEQEPMADGTAREPVCGELESGDDRQLVIKAKTATGTKSVPVPVTDVEGMAVVASCSE